ncbi:DUF6049 family protein [Dermatophilaceae bacterium Sec6.4]
MGRVLTRWVAAITALFTLAWTVGVAPVQAAPPPAYASATATNSTVSKVPTIAITSVTPTIARPNRPVFITGMLQAGQAALSTPKLTAGLSTTSLDTSSKLQQWNAGTSGIQTVTRTATSLAPLAAGGRQPFALTIPASAFPNGYRTANLPLLLSLLDGRGTAPKGIWRTTISFVGKAPNIPLPVTWLVPLTLPADSALFGPSGAARDRAWARAIGPGSRIDTLLSTLSGQPITWVVDPAITVPAPAADPTVPSAGAPRPGAAPPGSTTSTPPPSTPPPSSSPASTSPAGSTPPPSSPTSGSTASTASATPSGTPASPTSTTSAPTPGSGSTSPTGTGSSTGQVPTGSGSPSSSPSSPSSTGGTVRADPVEALTAQLRERLRTLPRSQSVLWTAHDDPDLSGLVRSGAGGARVLREEVARTLRPDMAAISSTEVAWPANGVNAGDVAEITGAWSRADRPAPVLVLPTSGITGAQSATGSAQRSIAGTSGALLYNESLSALVGSDTADPGLRAQQFLAQTLTIYDERPAVRRSLAIAVPRAGGATAAVLSTIISAGRTAPWLTDRSGVDAVRVAAGSPRASVRADRGSVTFPSPGATAVTIASLSRITAQRGQLSGLNSLLVDSLDVVSDRLHLVDNLGSTRWRDHVAGARNASRFSSDAMSRILESVSVAPSPVNFFTDRGSIAITVVNTLSRRVQGVQVLLRPRAIALKVERQPAPVSLGASSRGLVRPQLAAAGSGAVAVDVLVETANGVRLGKPPVRQANLEVNVRPTATWIYWVLGGVAALILLLGVIRSIRRGPRGAEQDVEPAGSTGPDTVVAGPTREPSPDPGINENDHDE